MKDKNFRYYTKVKFVYPLIFLTNYAIKFHFLLLWSSTAQCAQGQINVSVVANQDPYLYSQPATCPKYKIRKTKILN